MAICKNKKFKVVFKTNVEPVEQITSDILITELMVIISRVGLRGDRDGIDSDIIKMEKEHVAEKN